MGTRGTPKKRTSTRRKPAKRAPAKRAASKERPGFIGGLTQDLMILASTGAAILVTLSIFMPSFSRPVAPAIHDWLQSMLGVGMYLFAGVLLIFPAVLFTTTRRRFFFKAWVWAVSLTLLTSLGGGLYGTGGAIGDGAASLGVAKLGSLYWVLLVCLALIVLGRLAGRSLIIPLAKGTVRAAIRTGEAVADVSNAVREEAVDLAQQRREKQAQQAKLRSEQEKKIIKAELEAADAPEGDSPLVSAPPKATVAKTKVKIAPDDVLPPVELAIADSKDSVDEFAQVVNNTSTDQFASVVEDRISAAATNLPASPDVAGDSSIAASPGDSEGENTNSPAASTDENSIEGDDGEGQLLMFPSTLRGYNLPPLELLKEAPPLSGDDHQLKERAVVIERTLKSFKIEAHCINAVVGPRVTRFEVKIGAGINVNRIHNLADNIALELAVKAVRIEAPIPGMSAVGIEVPNATPELITLRSVLESTTFRSSNHPLTVGLGRDIAGNPIVANLAKMPHLLVAGATGSGKSVCLNALIVSLLMRNAPDTLRLILIDPKRVEMTNYTDLPQLSCPVVHDVGEAQSALKWVVAEMDLRYRMLERRRARNIAAYNEMVKPDMRLPFIVVVVDELADLMMMAGPVIEKLVCRIAQLSRAVGIHLVIATQRPDVKVITGTIKANIPSRIAFATVSYIDSRTILDASGSEKLLGSGDMLFSPIGENIPLRVQGCYLDDSEIDRVVEFCRSQAPASYNEEITTFNDEDEEDDGDKKGSSNARDALYEQAREITEASQKASTSYLQRRLRIGYNRAARIMDELEDANVVSPPDHQGNREVM